MKANVLSFPTFFDLKRSEMKSSARRCGLSKKNGWVVLSIVSIGSSKHIFQFRKAGFEPTSPAPKAGMLPVATFSVLRTGYKQTKRIRLC